MDMMFNDDFLTRGPGERGAPIYNLYTACPTPKGMVFEPFCSVQPVVY